MMKESIFIENLGPLKKVELNDITPMTVFVGESGNGKSTIMKVLILFRWIYKKVCIRSYLRNSSITKSPFRFNFQKLIANNGLSDYFQPDTLIEYHRGDYVISYKSGSLYSDITIKNEDLSLDKLSFISDKRNVIPELLCNGVEINNSFYLAETWNDFKKSMESFIDVNIPYLDVKLTRKKAQNGYKFYIEGIAHKDYQVKFEDSSSGIQNVVPLIAVMDYFVNRYDLVSSFNRAIVSVLSDSDLLSKFKPEMDIGKINYKNLFFHIEEPELSLYPQSQLELMNQMLDICFKSADKKFDVSCMITTHSPYIINYLNLLIKEKKINFEDLKVYEIISGTVRLLNIDEKRIVNTAVLSEPIAGIYKRYNEL
ncbi:MAG: AAA family ATPase [Treponema sp.]|nr:AAA family ATPase [Treponema sp.]